jgi:hypothetical protein
LYLDFKPAGDAQAPKSGEAAVNELAQVLPVVSVGPQLDTSAWDSRPDASQPLEVLPHV